MPSIPESTTKKPHTARYHITTIHKIVQSTQSARQKFLRKDSNMNAKAQKTKPLVPVNDPDWILYPGTHIFALICGNKNCFLKIFKIVLHGNLNKIVF